METALNYTDETMYLSSDERRIISQISRLASEFPEEVEIIKEPDSNGGCIYCKLPASWFKLRPPLKLTAEQKERKKAQAMENFLLKS